MSRRRHKGGRGISITASRRRRLYPFHLDNLGFLPVMSSDLSYGDRRRYHPSSNPPFSTLGGHLIYPTVSYPRETQRNESFRYSYTLPTSAMLCVRRKVRREVLFASGRVSYSKRPKFTDSSSIHC